MYENQLMDKENIELMTLRRLCFACPIWRECLTIGFKYERYGHWGGLAADERNHMAENQATKRVARLQKQLDELNVDWEEIVKISKTKRELIW
jgi:hypothetical protein